MNIFYEKIKQKSFLSIITFFASLFATTVPYSIIALATNLKYKNLVELNIYLFFVILVLASVIPNVLFSYLNSKAEVDFYNSLPVSKKRMFLSNYFAGIFLFLIPFVLNYVLFIYLVNAENLRGFMAMFYYIGAFVSIYSVFTVSTIITGNRFLSSAVGMFFIVAPILIINMHNKTIDIFSQTSHTQGDLLLSSLTSFDEIFTLEAFMFDEKIITLLISPIVNLYYALTFNKSYLLGKDILSVDEISITSIVCFFVFSIVVTFKAYSFFKMRKSEIFKQPIAIKFLKTPIKCMIVIFVAIVTMANIIFNKNMTVPLDEIITSDYIFSFIMSILISLGIFIIMELIEFVKSKAKDKIFAKMLLKNSYNYIFSITLFVIIFTSYSVVINAYDEKIVPKEDILSIGIDEMFDIDYHDSNIIDAYYEITESGIANLNISSYEKQYMEEVCITYNLKNASNYKRYYMVSPKQLYEANIIVANSSEYIEKCIYQSLITSDMEFEDSSNNMIFQPSNDKISEIEEKENTTQIGGSEKTFINLKPFEIKELLSILATEMQYLNAEYFKYNKPLYKSFVVEKETGYWYQFFVFEAQVKSIDYIKKLAENQNIAFIDVNETYDIENYDALYLKIEKDMFYNEDFVFPNSYMNMDVYDNLNYDEKVSIILENNEFIKITNAEHINDICENLKISFNGNTYSTFGSDTIYVYAYPDSYNKTYNIGYIECGIIN